MCIKPASNGVDKKLAALHSSHSLYISAPSRFISLFLSLVLSCSLPFCSMAGGKAAKRRRDGEEREGKAMRNVPVFFRFGCKLRVGCCELCVPEHPEHPGPRCTHIHPGCGQLGAQVTRNNKNQLHRKRRGGGREEAIEGKERTRQRERTK